MRRFLPLISFLFFALYSKSQDNLFQFKVSDAGANKARIEWINPYNEGCLQLNIQSSYDSVKGFATIFSSISPELPRNGFIYNAPNAGYLYYRIFYVLSGGVYFFTPAKKISTGFSQPSEVVSNQQDSILMITVRNKDSVLAVLTPNQFFNFRDSIITKTKDSLFIITPQDVLLKYFVPIEIWIPSIYVYTNKDGNIKIDLPEAKEKKYQIEIFDENKKHLFSFHKITDTELTLEKVNFLHAGWYYFELYEGDKLKEKNKFYIARDF